VEVSLKVDIVQSGQLLLAIAIKRTMIPLLSNYLCLYVCCILLLNLVRICSDGVIVRNDNRKHAKLRKLNDEDERVSWVQEWDDDCQLAWGLFHCWGLWAQAIPVGSACERHKSNFKDFQYCLSTRILAQGRELRALSSKRFHTDVARYQGSLIG
jgi:hypothetical protein